MSLLSTFGILFETDAEKAKREVDGVTEGLGKATGEAEGATEKFNDFDGALDKVAGGLLGMSGEAVKTAAKLASVSAVLVGFFYQVSSNDEIGKFSETLGLNIEDVGAWGEAVKRSGGDAASFRGSLQGLNSQLTDISLTGGGESAEIFARLGINALDAGGKIRSAFDVLPELADSFQNLSKSESVGFGQKLGLDQGTILLLQQGRVAVEELVGRQKELGVATQEDYLAAAKFNDAWDDSKQAFANLMTSAGSTILPLLTMTLEGLESVVAWVKKNQTLVTGFFIAVAGVVTALYLPAMTSAAVATLAAAAPFLIIGAAIAAVGVAFAILYEDVVAYLGGQESYIGDLAKKYEWFGAIVDAVINAVKFQIKTLGAVFDWLTDLFLSPVETINKLGQSIKDMVNDALNVIPEIGESFEEAFSGVKSFFGIEDDEINANVNKAINVTGAINNNPLNGQTSASIVNSQQSISRSNTVSVGGTTVHTQATDAQGVANAIGSSLNNQIQMAVGQLDDAEAY